jgi:hemoglobin-like flavoprotein
MKPVSDDATQSVLGVLEVLCTREHEAALVDRFYDRFFDRNPEVVPLFGEHALAEREEMIQETLKSLLAACEGESWLDANLEALGKSHAEYGVETGMYPAFATAFLETLREILGDRFPSDAEKHFAEMLEGICGVMSAAGEGAG